MDTKTTNSAHETEKTKMMPKASIQDEKKKLSALESLRMWWQKTPKRTQKVLIVAAIVLLALGVVGIPMMVQKWQASTPAVAQLAPANTKKNEKKDKTGSAKPSRDEKKASEADNKPSEEVQGQAPSKPTQQGEKTAPAASGTPSKQKRDAAPSTSSNNNGSAKKNTNSTSNNNASAEPAPQKRWIDEQGHWEPVYEQVWVVDQAAWTETIPGFYRFSDGHTCSTLEEAANYLDDHDVSYSVIPDKTVTHPEQGHYENKEVSRNWVVDVPGHWE